MAKRLTGQKQMRRSLEREQKHPVSFAQWKAKEEAKVKQQQQQTTTMIGAEDSDLLFNDDVTCDLETCVGTLRRLSVKLANCGDKKEAAQLVNEFLLLTWDALDALHCMTHMEKLPVTFSATIVKTDRRKKSMDTYKRKTRSRIYGMDVR
jgi:hypothetical protein